jgi:hypothetical protein
MFVCYLLSITQVLKDTEFRLVSNWCECGNLFIIIFIQKYVNSLETYLIGSSFIYTGFTICLVWCP